MDMLITGVVVVVIATLAGLVFIQDDRKKESRYFLILCVMIACWIVSSTLTNHYFGENLQINTISNYLAYVFGYLALVSGFLFSRHFPVKSTMSGMGKGLVATLVITTIALSMTDYVAGKVVVENGKLSFLNGELLGLYAVSFLVIIVLLSKNLVASIRKSKGKIRQQAKLTLAAFVSAAFIGITTNVVLPLFGLSAEDTTRFAPLSAVVLVTITSYAIVRHGLFDIRLAAVRTLAYTLSLATLAGVYYGIVYVISVVLLQSQTTSGISISPVNILLALALAFLFQPIKSFFDKVTNTIFYRDRYDSSEFYLKLNDILMGTAALEEMLKSAAHEICTTLKSDQTFFVIARNRDDYMQAGTSRHHKLPMKDIYDLNSFIESHGEGIILASLLSEEDRHLSRILISHGIELVMPLVRHGAIVGYCLMGDQRTSGYTKRDLKVLETISDELVIAVQHAMSVEQVKSINENLEQRIETATAELRTSNARLKRLDASKDEFLSMASHQLRTPLTSIKGYLSMMLEGDVGKVSPMQKKVLEEAFTSSERMVHLIHDFLNVSRLQTGKFVLELQEVDLAELVSGEVKSLKRAAGSRNMTLKFTNKAGSMPMTLDDTKVRQVVMNYIDNAIFYSHTDTTITIELTKTEKEAVLTVTDTGIGVPADEQDQLFGKFFRATNARKQRPDGTGVGLYLAKKVITALGGEVVFKSKLGRGSTFGFRLPLDQDTKKLEDNTKQFKDQPTE